MIKRTIYFGNPAYLKTKDEQLVVTLPELKSGLNEELRSTTIPIEDIGVIILDHQQITISQALIAKLLANNVALITCDNSHHPTGLLLNLDGHSLQSQKFKNQIEASLPLKKQLWQQTIKTKISNQGKHLEKLGIDAKAMRFWSDEVLSGDGAGHEGRAAAFYWKSLTPILKQNSSDDKIFIRDREGEAPNNLLNYGYAILRAIVARNLVGSGLLPTLGIHHRNQYNSYCLADDIMEPYRPIVDELVIKTWLDKGKPTEIDTELKRALLQIPTIDIQIDGQKSPLMVGLQRTTASLAACFEGTIKKLVYPEL